MYLSTFQDIVIDIAFWVRVWNNNSAIKADLLEMWKTNKFADTV